ncbi:hypothetical protein [Defluviitalea raffinosedens]|uniref:Uncharacterized protein n=1 Tax=Defluviitalea raffinosedens TaxID=1450156 RepID=A0A7C8HGK6_9FIRM|nr:hypothetical protein [Defluviitalea raffinosedens]KAE9637338.1 hypothetical protein GND95_02590 [Defluviitalea raffinosedens]MBM7685645.1 hypothetical protein [Defluviitalea raffinosedens]HHW66626.1 hypothetical protein [Candidatus Epulonipiscium sp.]
MNSENNNLETNLSASFKESVPLAFLNFLKSTIGISSNEFIPYIDGMDEKIEQIADYVKNVLLSLEDILNEASTQKFNRIQELINYKNTISNLFCIAYGYVTELNILSFIIEEQYQLEQFKKSDIGVLDYDHFYEECSSFIFHHSKDEDKMQRLREVLKHIPIRITKDKFYDYIEKSIELIEVSEDPKELERFFDMLKLQFIGTSVDGYEEFLPDIVSSINHIKSQDLLKMNEDDITALWEEVEITGDILSKIIMILSLLYKALNALSILIMLENVNLQTLYNRHVAYKDFYLSASTIVNWASDPEERELLVETLPDLLDRHIEILESNLEKKHSEIMRQIQKKNEDLDLLSKEIQNYQLVLYYLNTDLSDLFSYERKSKASVTMDKILKPYIEEFKHFIDEQLQVMPNIFRKARMQHFLGILPPAMNEKEFRHYLQNAIESCSTEERKALVLSKIGIIMDSSGFFDHDHQSCDCGHDHHHDHHHDEEHFHIHDHNHHHYH